MSDIVDELSVLYVWPQSVADHHADTLTPRQIEKLYEVGAVAERAVAEIARLRAELAEARDKALDEAADVTYFTCAQTRHVRLGDECAQAIRALKSPKPPIL